MITYHQLIRQENRAPFRVSFPSLNGTLIAPNYGGNRGFLFFRCVPCIRPKWRFRQNVFVTTDESLCERGPARFVGPKGPGHAEIYERSRLAVLDASVLVDCQRHRIIGRIDCFRDSIFGRVHHIAKVQEDFPCAGLLQICTALQFKRCLFHGALSEFRSRPWALVARP